MPDCDCRVIHAPTCSSASPRVVDTPECHGCYRRLTLDHASASLNEMLLKEDIAAAEQRVAELKRILAMNARYL